MAKQDFDETATIADVSSEEFDLGFGEINYDTGDSCYVATVDGLVDSVDGSNMNGAGESAESEIPDPPWISAAAESTGSMKCPALDIAIAESTKSAPFASQHHGSFSTLRQKFLSAVPGIFRLVLKLCSSLLVAHFVVHELEVVLHLHLKIGCLVCCEVTIF